MSKKKDESPLEGFDNIIGGLIPETHNDVANMDVNNVDVNDDPEDVVDLSIKQDKTEPEVNTNKLDNKDDKDVKTTDGNIEFTDETIQPEEQETETSTTVENSEETEDEDQEVDESEKAGVTDFFDAFSEALGWDVDDENKPTTVEDLVDYVKSVVDENSVPEYGDDRIKELDEFVKNGGRFEDFYNLQSSEINYDTIDLTEESNQKQVIRDYLQMSGLSDDQIAKKISRFEDAGLLEDEANDNLELLKERKAYEKEETLKMQQQKQAEYEENNRQIIKNITDNINNLTEVRGINVPAEDRKKLLDYAFKTDVNGQTQFQKDYAKNATKNFIETAYFSMKGDALLNSAKRSGESSAINKLKQTLKTSTKRNGSKYSMDNGSARPVWTAASNLFGSR